MKLLSFEKELAPLYEAIKKKKMQDKSVKDLITKLESKIEYIYGNLTPYNIVEIARHIERPRTEDYISALFNTFIELHGDRKFGDDPAIVAGIGEMNGRVMGVIGHRKGHNLRENMHYRFGMAEPEGYRKALRVMHLVSECFHSPIITFLDTPGASPTSAAEERGQAEAIAVNLQEMFNIPTPIVSVVIGEGGSGGALGIGVADRLLMLKYSIYSVISPEGCASILWRDISKAKDAANALKLTAKDLKELDIVDEIIDEPVGGAHRHKEKTINNVKNAIEKNMDKLIKLSPKVLLRKRREKYRNIGVFNEQK